LSHQRYKYVDDKGRYVVVEFSRGGIMYKLKERQRIFLQSITPRELYEIDNLGLLSDDMNVYREVLMEVNTNGHYKSGKQERVLNLLRRVVLHNRLKNFNITLTFDIW